AMPLIYRRRGSHDPRRELRGFVRAGGGLCRSDSQGRQACRSAGAAGNRIRADHQSEDCLHHWRDYSADAHRPRRRGDRMRRREFIALLGAAAARPLGARAQQPGKLPTIGFLGSTTPAAQSQLTAAFVQRLRELGWIEGRTVTIEYRWAEGRSERLAEFAAEFVRLKVDVILTHNTPPVLAAKQATSVIPIVFATAADPVGTGVVASLPRP